MLGDGATKCDPFVKNYPEIKLMINQMPSAKNMGNYCMEKYNNKAFENVAYFEPFYLKEFFSGK